DGAYSGPLCGSGPVRRSGDARRMFVGVRRATLAATPRISIDGPGARLESRRSRISPKLRADRRTVVLGTQREPIHRVEYVRHLLQRLPKHQLPYQGFQFCDVRDQSQVVTGQRRAIRKTYTALLRQALRVLPELTQLPKSQPDRLDGPVPPFEK